MESLTTNPREVGGGKALVTDNGIHRKGQFHCQVTLHNNQLQRAQRRDGHDDQHEKPDRSKPIPAGRTGVRAIRLVLKWKQQNTAGSASSHLTCR